MNLVIVHIPLFINTYVTPGAPAILGKSIYIYRTTDLHSRYTSVRRGDFLSCVLLPLPMLIPLTDNVMFFYNIVTVHTAVLCHLLLMFRHLAVCVCYHQGILSELLLPHTTILVAYAVTRKFWPAIS